MLFVALMYYLGFYMGLGLFKIIERGVTKNSYRNGSVGPYSVQSFCTVAGNDSDFKQKVTTNTIVMQGGGQAVCCPTNNFGVALTKIFGRCMSRRVERGNKSKRELILW